MLVFFGAIFFVALAIAVVLDRGTQSPGPRSAEAHLRRFHPTA